MPQVEDVAVGDLVLIRPNARVSSDGVVVDGRSAIDQSAVTGESMPVTKSGGDTLIGGTINGSGGLVMRAERVGTETMLARIVTMVADAQRSRAPIQRTADKVSAVFVPVVIAIAVIAFVAWGLAGPDPKLAHALIVSVAVLIIACPCALGLATPMSIMVGVGRGARLGVLIKNAEALERMEKVDTLVVDKTGTLTEGRPTVTHIEAVNGDDPDDLLRTAAAVERSSEHPLAQAIVEALSKQTVTVAGTDAAGVVLPHLARQLIALHTQRADIAAQVEALVEAHPLYQVLTSMPGIGVRTAAVFLAETLGKTFDTGAQLASYAGLAPVTRRSGSSIRGEHVSHGGNKRLKRAMFLSAFASLRSDPVSRAYYQRKRDQGKRHNQAVLALAHRRILTLHAMIRNGTLYNPQPAQPLTTTA